jgi:hypothetical protein
MNDDLACWLPGLICLRDYDGDWDRYVTALYERFRADFILSTPQTLSPKRWGIKRYPIVRGCEATFWHLISSGDIEEDRLPDLRRCERIGWPRALIDALGTTAVHSWTTKKRNELRVQIALPDFSYIVSIADRGEYVLLWTAFCVEHEHQRRKYRQEYEHSKS